MIQTSEAGMSLQDFLCTIGLHVGTWGETAEEEIKTSFTPDELGYRTVGKKDKEIVIGRLYTQQYNCHHCGYVKRRIVSKETAT